MRSLPLAKASSTSYACLRSKTRLKKHQKECSGALLNFEDQHLPEGGSTSFFAYLSTIVGYIAKRCPLLHKNAFYFLGMQAHLNQFLAGRQKSSLSRSQKSTNLQIEPIKHSFWCFLVK